MSPRAQKLLLVLTSVFLGWSILAWSAARLLIVNAPLEQAEAIAVLSGSAAYKERTRLAAELFKSSRGQRIILTNDNEQGGWSSREERNPFFYELERAELLSLGVPGERIVVLLEPVSSTDGEAVVLREYAEANRLKSLLVVTSAYHSRRALWTLRRAFAGSGTRVGLEAVKTGLQTPGPATWWLHMRGWNAVPVEYFKLVYYRLVNR